MKYTCRKIGKGTRKYVIFEYGKAYSNFTTRKQAKRLLKKLRK